MATWLEIRCDLQLPPRSFANKCLSFNNDGPHQMASDDNASVLRALRDMRKEAASTGWKRINGAWVCPHCVNHPAAPSTSAGGTA